jgi:hypothetical protein
MRDASARKFITARLPVPLRQATGTCALLGIAFLIVCVTTASDAKSADLKAPARYGVDACAAVF